ncbi:MAG: hypothetical protein KGL79_01355, partial [Acidobacteriota bacterium]|nr:hypothetical protein [Acidobacteriota bacterium]
ELARALLVDHPGAVADLVAAAGFALDGVEIVIPGASNAFTQHVRSKAMFRTVLVSGPGPSELFEGRRAGLAYVCRGGVCEAPATTLADFERQLRDARS